MKGKNRLIFPFALLLCLSLAAQNAFVDSLAAMVQDPGTGIKKQFEGYNRLTEWYRTAEQYQKAETLNAEHLKLALDGPDYLEATKAFVHRGIIQNNREAYGEDRVALDSARATAARTNNKVAQAYADYLEAYILLSYQDYGAAIKVFQQVESAVENTDEELLKGKTYYNLYTIYTNWNDLENTMLYANKAVEAGQRSGDRNFLSNAYSALAVAYTYQYDASKNKEDRDRVFEICERAVALGQRFNNEVGSRTYAIAKLNLASYYFEYYPDNLPLIREKTQEALKTAEAAVGNQTVLANCYGLLSALAQNENDDVREEAYLKQAYDILLTETPVYYHTMIRVCESLAELYQGTQRYAEAYTFQKRSTDYTMALFDQEQASTSKRLQAQYQFEKKEQEVAMLQERSENQRMQKLLYAGLGIVALAGSFFMFRSYHFRLRYSLQAEKRLKIEKHDAELQVRLEREEQARLKAERELLALQQQKLQDEVMANQLHLQHKNEVLHKLKEKLHTDVDLNIKQIIREENLLDRDFEKAKFQIQELHPDFFKILSENAKKKLTSLDVKYCAYFYLGMDTKQIASLLNVEPKSVRMTKYRLKQKFGLDAETDLVNHLKHLV